MRETIIRFVIRVLLKFLILKFIILKFLKLINMGYIYRKKNNVKKSVRKSVRKSTRKSLKKSLRKNVRKGVAKSVRKSARKGTRKPSRNINYKMVETKTLKILKLLSVYDISKKLLTPLTSSDYYTNITKSIKQLQNLKDDSFLAETDSNLVNNAIELVEEFKIMFEEYTNLKSMESLNKIPKTNFLKLMCNFRSESLYKKTDDIKNAMDDLFESTYKRVKSIFDNEKDSRDIEETYKLYSEFKIEYEGLRQTIKECVDTQKKNIYEKSIVLSEDLISLYEALNGFVDDQTIPVKEILIKSREFIDKINNLIVVFPENIQYSYFDYTKEITKYLNFLSNIDEQRTFRTFFEQDEKYNDELTDSVKTMNLRFKELIDTIFSLIVELNFIDEKIKFIMIKYRKIKKNIDDIRVGYSLNTIKRYKR